MKQSERPFRERTVVALAILCQTLIAIVAMTLLTVFPANAQWIESSATVYPDSMILVPATEAELNLSQDARNLLYVAASAVVVNGMNNNGNDEKYVVGFSVIGVFALVDNIVTLFKRNNRLKEERDEK